MVLAINKACSLLNAKSCTPLCVVSESTMMSGWFSGQPVAKAVTKSAAVDRLVIDETLSGFSCLLYFGHVSADFDFDLGPDIDKPVHVEQRRWREVAPERLLPGCADAGAGRFVFAAAGQIPGQADDMLGPRAGLAEQLDDPLQRVADLGRHVRRIRALFVATGLAR